MLYSCGRPTKRLRERSFARNSSPPHLTVLERLGIEMNWGFDRSSTSWSSHILTVIANIGHRPIHTHGRSMQISVQRTNSQSHQLIPWDPLGFPGPVVLPTPFLHFDILRPSVILWWWCFLGNWGAKHDSLIICFSSESLKMPQVQGSLSSRRLLRAQFQRTSLNWCYSSGHSCHFRSAFATDIVKICENPQVKPIKSAPPLPRAERTGLRAQSSSLLVPFVRLRRDPSWSIVVPRKRFQFLPGHPSHPMCFNDWAQWWNVPELEIVSHTHILYIWSSLPSSQPQQLIAFYGPILWLRRNVCVMHCWPEARFANLLWFLTFQGLD